MRDCKVCKDYPFKYGMCIRHYARWLFGEELRFGESTYDGLHKPLQKEIILGRNKK